jgi:hypothetical protein
MIASSLFHFTKELDTILKILNSKALRASPNFESVENFFQNQMFLSTPMVCFCDIPLKFITKEHTIRYGNYGLGFKKSWGIKKKINPILYRMHNTEFSTSFNKSVSGIDQVIEKLKIFESLNDQYYSMIEDVLWSMSNLQSHFKGMATFVKPYEEEDSNGIKNNYVDREWRWVPESCEKEFHDSINKDEQDKRKKTYLESPDYLAFESHDLKYIIVKDPKEIAILLKAIEGLALSESKKHSLCQKIIDLESINQDM